MYTFTALHNVVTKVSIAAGFCFPGMLQINKKWYPILVLNSIISTVPLFYIIACNLVFYYMLGPYDVMLHGITFVGIVNVFDTFYYLHSRNEFQSLLQNFDNVTQDIIDSNFTSNSDVNYILNAARKFNNFMKYYVPFVLLQIVPVTIGSYVLRYIFAYNFLYFDVPYRVETEFMFHITGLLQTFSGLYACFKTVCSWSVMFLLLFHIKFYLKTLRNSLKDFNLVDTEKQRYYNFNVITKTGNIYALRSWVKLHQKILRLISQFNKLYSPLLLVHLLNFYASGLCYTFAITVQKESLIISLPILSFVTVEMVVFLALSTIGNELTYQSAKVFQHGYYIIHLSTDNTVSSFGLITGEVANRPVIISVFGSEYFNLTMDTFIWMIKSMASLYVGLTQIEKLNEN